MNLSEEALVPFLVYRYFPPPLSIFKDVSVLRPGQEIAFNEAGFSISEPEVMAFAQPSKLEQHQSALSEKERISEALHAGVASVTSGYLTSADAVRLFFSGGVDSSLLLKVLVNIGTPNLSLVTMYSEPNAHTGDLQVSSKFARDYGLQQSRTQITASRWRDAFPQAAMRLGQPYGHAFSAYFFESALPQQTSKSLLVSGDLADGLFGSSLLARLSLPVEVFRKEGRNILLAQDADKFSLLEYLAGRGDSWPIFANQTYRSLCSWAPRLTGVLDNLANEFLEQSADLWDYDALNRILIHQFRFAAPHTLMGPTRRLLGPLNDVRFPFASESMVALAFDIHGNTKINHSGKVHESLQTKTVLKLLAIDLGLGDAVFRKPEGGQLPTNSWMRSNYREEILDSLMSRRSIGAQLMPRSDVDKVLRRWDSGSDEDQYMIWALWILELWLAEVYPHLRLSS